MLAPRGLPCLHRSPPRRCVSFGEAEPAPCSLHPLSPSPFPLPFSCSLSSRHHAARHGRSQPSSGLTALATVRCSSDPVITTISVDTPSSAWPVASLSSSAIVHSCRRGRSPDPPCSCGQATTGHLGPSRGYPREHAGLLVLRLHSPAAGEPPPAGTDVSPSASSVLPR